MILLSEDSQSELDCEAAIILDKQRFGRVRTSLMKHLRLKYGEKTANRALSRINKRISKGSLKSRKYFEDVPIN